MSSVHHGDLSAPAAQSLLCPCREVWVWAQTYIPSLCLYTVTHGQDLGGTLISQVQEVVLGRESGDGHVVLAGWPVIYAVRMIYEPIHCIQSPGVSGSKSSRNYCLSWRIQRW